MSTNHQKPFTPGEEKVHDLGDEVPGGMVKSVLMLEDDDDFAELLQEYLESQSFQVTRVPSGVDGLRKIMAADFDVILCDLVMSNLPGDMFYLAVERTKPHLCHRFIFMSGHKADPKWDAFVRKVRGLVLWKPFEMQDLMQAIESATKKGPSPNPSLEK